MDKIIIENMIKESTQPLSDDEIEKIMMAVVAFYNEPITESELIEQTHFLTDWANQAKCDIALSNLILEGKLAAAYKNGQPTFKLMTKAMSNRNTVYEDEDTVEHDPADWWKNT